MRWLLASVLLATSAMLHAQYPTGDAAQPAPPAMLPDAPGSLRDMPNCRNGRAPVMYTLPDGRQQPICPEELNPYKPFLNSTVPIPLTPEQKFKLAMHDIYDPFNLLTIAANSAVTVGIDSHSAYGPGMRGFAKNVGYSLSQDATGEVIGTWAIASIAHQDPHYHRMAHGPVGKRLLHAISRTVIAQHDNGRIMPNYEVLLTYPISAGISNLYVPGVAVNGPSTVKRVLTGYATNPAGDLVAEFLPDLARRVHIRVIFVQQILNQVAVSNP